MPGIVQNALYILSHLICFKISWDRCLFSSSSSGYHEAAEAQRAHRVTARWPWWWNLAWLGPLLAYRIFVQRQGISPFGHTPPHARLQGLISQRGARFQSLLPLCPCAGFTLRGGHSVPRHVIVILDCPRGWSRLHRWGRSRWVHTEILRAGHATSPTPQLAMRHVGVLGPGGRASRGPVSTGGLDSAQFCEFTSEQLCLHFSASCPITITPARPPKAKRPRTASFYCERECAFLHN